MDKDKVSMSDLSAAFTADVTFIYLLSYSVLYKITIYFFFFAALCSK